MIESYEKTDDSLDEEIAKGSLDKIKHLIIEIENVVEDHNKPAIDLNTQTLDSGHVTKQGEALMAAVENLERELPRLNQNNKLEAEQWLAKAKIYLSDYKPTEN
jgi:hypothetical protein